MTRGFDVIECDQDDCSSEEFAVGRYDDGIIELRCLDCGHLMWGQGDRTEDAVDAGDGGEGVAE